MLRLFAHHDYGVLAERLLDELKEREDPLATETLLVPNYGLGRWLKVWIAERLGVAANLNVKLPASFLWAMLRGALGDIPEDSPFDPEMMRWYLFDLLEDMAKVEPSLEAYLDTQEGIRNPNEALRELKRFQLARRLAEVFCEYGEYEPEMLDLWEKGANPGSFAYPWQGELWRRFVNRASASFGEGIREVRSIERLSELLSERGDLGFLPTRVFWFGFANVSPAYLRAFVQLSAHTNLYAFLADPNVPFLKGASFKDPKQQVLEPPNPFVKVMGRAGRGFLKLLSHELKGLRPRFELFPQNSNGDGRLLSPNSGTLLKRVQASISQDGPSEKTGGIDGDVSIQVHSCSSPLREVQVLYNQLLDIMGRLEGLEPRDIVVMMPEVSRYAPAIEGVFGNPNNPLELPFSVCDKPRNAWHPLGQAFLAFLDIPASRFALSEIVALLSTPATMRAFDISEADIQKIKVWAVNAGVRWGLDEETRRAFRAGNDGNATWSFGLNRLFLGLAQPNEDTLLGGIAPYADLEGQGAQALGKLDAFIRRLREWQAKLKDSKTPERWLAELAWLIETMFCLDSFDEEESYAKRLIDESLAGLELALRLPLKTPMAWETVREALLEGLGKEAAYPPFPSGGITFCGMVHLRALPFRVVCLLGMNDETFPRKEGPGQRLSLIRGQKLEDPRPGYRSLAEDDRLLFLQCLMAARDVFYTSYIGRDLQTGRELRLSQVVLELDDYLKKFHGVALEDLMARHPISPFHPSYLDPSSHPRVFSFERGWFSRKDTAQKPLPPLQGAALDPIGSLERLELDTLKRFFKNPTKHFLNERLNIDLKEKDDEPKDEEDLKFDPLRAWQLRDDLLKRAQSASESGGLKALRSLYEAKGMLPPSPLGEVIFEGELKKVQDLLWVWDAWKAKAKPLEPLWVEFFLKDATFLEGRLNGVFASKDDSKALGLWRVLAGKLHMGNVLPLWIEYLFYLSSGRDGDLRVAGLDPRNDHKVAYGVWAMEKDKALGCLEDFIELYRLGLERPLPFMPKLAEAFLERTQEGEEKAKEWLITEKLELEKGFKEDSEVLEPHFRMHAFLDVEDFPVDEFARLARRVLEPITQSRRGLSALADRASLTEPIKDLKNPLA